MDTIHVNLSHSNLGQWALFILRGTITEQRADGTPHQLPTFLVGSGSKFFSTRLGGCGSHVLDAGITTILWLCCSFVAALANGLIRKTKAMSAPYVMS